MKFGGTSVANFEAITRAIFIVGGRLDKKPVVVVSALSKVTDLLYRRFYFHFVPPFKLLCSESYTSLR